MRQKKANNMLSERSCLQNRKWFLTYAAHIYRGHVQQSAFKQVKEELAENENAFLIDFSENYVLKDGIDNQASHFGYKLWFSKESVILPPVHLFLSWLWYDWRKLHPPYRHISNRSWSIFWKNSTNSNELFFLVTAFHRNIETVSHFLQSIKWWKALALLGRVGFSQKPVMEKELLTVLDLLWREIATTMLREAAAYGQLKISKIHCTRGIPFQTPLLRGFLHWDENERLLKESAVAKVPGITETHFVKLDTSGNLLYSNLYCRSCNVLWNSSDCLPLRVVENFYEKSKQIPKIETETDLTPHFTVNQWVIAKFGDKRYPGQILSVMED